MCQFLHGICIGKREIGLPQTPKIQFKTQKQIFWRAHNPKILARVPRGPDTKSSQNEKVLEGPTITTQPFEHDRIRRHLLGKPLPVPLGTWAAAGCCWPDTGRGGGGRVKLDVWRVEQQSQDPQELPCFVNYQYLAIYVPLPVSLGYVLSKIYISRF